MSDEKRKRTSGIDRALQVMDILTERQEPMSAYDLAKSAGAPASRATSLRRTELEELPEPTTTMTSQ